MQQNLNNWLETFLNELPSDQKDKDSLAQQLIKCFDVEFDIPLNHSQCTGLLEILGAYEKQENPDNLRLAVEVGAWWCRIVSYDVNYRLLEGLEALESSRANAKKLRDKVLNNAVNPDFSDEKRQFMAYAAARWHDGAGKIHYRCNDYSVARLLFEQAQELAEKGNLWYCLPDIQSNLIRTPFEESSTVGSSVNLQQEYEQLIGRLEKQINPSFNSNLIPIQNQEFLRGKASLWHNLSLEYKKTEKKSSEQASKKSEVICLQLSDQYRLAQALNHQAILALESKKWDKARALFEKVVRLSWVRGRRIAKQQLARLDARKGDLSIALEKIKQLLNELQEERQLRGGDLGLDIRFYYFTVQAFKDILEQIEKAPLEHKLNLENIQFYHQRLQQEELAMIRSVRKVVKIGNYKQTFANTIYPIYLKQISNLLDNISNQSEKQQHSENQKKLEKAFTFVEEASCRELLDLIQYQTQDNGGDIEVVLKKPDSPIQFDIPISNQTRLCRGGIRNINEPLNQETLSAIRERLSTYESESLKSPISTVQHNPEIAYEIRMFTANYPGLRIVRYVCGDENNIAAYVFLQGKMYYRNLNNQKIKELLNEWNKKSVNSNPGIRFQKHWFENMMVRLFEELLQPFWEELIAQNNQKLENCHLVLIPSDELFSFPIHAALIPETNRPLAATIPLSFSVSATAYLSRGRHLLKRQFVEHDDELCALMMPDVSGKELENLDWEQQYLVIAGEPPEGSKIKPHGKANWEGLELLIKVKPEFFLYSGHGFYHPSLKTLGPALMLSGDCLTQFDVATKIRLPRNKLTLLGACLSGQGVNVGGGEIAGFLKAFIAAGCGALGITLWPVMDEEIAHTMEYILNKSREYVNSSEPFDVVKTLYEYYCQSYNKFHFASPIESCPLLLYL